MSASLKIFRLLPILAFNLLLLSFSDETNMLAHQTQASLKTSGIESLPDINNELFSDDNIEYVTIEFTVKTPVLPRAYSQVFISGSFNEWVTYDNQYRMKPIAPGTYHLALKLPKNNSFEYKYTLGNWKAAELTAKGGSTSNRKLKTDKDRKISDVVANWGTEFNDESFSDLKTSSPGHYTGYSKPIYDSWVFESKYITMRDGTQIALDIIRPAIDGEAESEALPVLWSMQRYQRGMLKNGTRTSILGHEGIQKMIKYGYVIVAADARGTGASTGWRKGEFSRDEAFDGHEITQWIASQKWCNGKVGMFGRSYMGISQYMVASTKPKNLKALFPEMAMFDTYDFIYQGGIFKKPFNDAWGNLIRYLDMEGNPAPADNDPEAETISQAIIQRAKNIYPDELNASLLPIREAWHDSLSFYPFIENSPSNYLEEINQAKIPAYIFAGWQDAYAKDALLWFANLIAPHKITIGSWHHGNNDNFDLTIERIRWFDYWLKGTDNGVMAEKPVYYHTSGTENVSGWASSDTWPVKGTTVSTYFLGAGIPSRPLATMQENVFPPVRDESFSDTYLFDLTTSSGKSSRWAATHGAKFSTPNMTLNDKKSLIYTSLPLKNDMLITGHPVLYLWVIPSQEDFELFVYLNEVDEKGKSVNLTEGCIRASHRLASKAPYQNLNTPWFRRYEEDLRPCKPGEPVLLCFDLIPLSHLVKKGHSIRISICAADADNALNSLNKPNGHFSILSSDTHSSFIEIPVVAK